MQIKLAQSGHSGPGIHALMAAAMLFVPGLASRLRACAVHPQPRFSDHAPYVVDYAD